MKNSKYLVKSLFTMCIFLPSINYSWAAGMVPQSSVVIIEGDSGEVSVEIKNTDNFPNLLITKIEDIEEDKEEIITAFPPVSRVEGDDTQTVRFIITNSKLIKTERLKRVIFEGVPPKNKELDKEVNVTFTQNLPVIIRPAGLAKNLTPWTGLKWEVVGKKIVVSNPSPYVVRFISPTVELLPGNQKLNLPKSYILPNQKFMIDGEGIIKSGHDTFRFFPATTWGFSSGEHYDAKI